MLCRAQGTNMDSFLSYDTKKELDYYGILGCSSTATLEQILVEFRVRAVELHPDKNPGDPHAVERFQQLQEAKATLSDPPSRARYDRWRSSGIAMPYRRWCNMALNGSTFHWAAPPQPDRMLQQEVSSQSDSLGHPEDTTDQPITSQRSPKVWRRETSDFLSKFRNYEI